MSNCSENGFNNTTKCSEDNMFSDELIIWIYNEHIYQDINLPCVVYLCVLGIFGIFGNSLVIYIYGFRFKRTNAHFFILSLAVFDTLCCFAMIMEVFDKRFPMYSGRYKIICKITRLTEMFATISSSLLMLCIALDRYYKICKPFKSFSSRKARRSLVGSVFIGVVLSWPMLLFHGPETVETGVENVVGCDCGDDDNFRGSIFPSIYFGLIGILNVIVIMLLTIMYVQIFRAILKWKKEDIGESLPSSPVSTVSTNYRLSRVITWLHNSKQKNDNETPNESCNTTDISSNHQITPADDNNGRTNGSSNVQPEVNGTSHKYHIHHNRTKNNRRYSTFSISSGPISLKNSKIVTTNTASFAIITVLYIISYLPTVFVETLNASGAYTDVALPSKTQRILVILNVTYFFNNVCNQYVYSAINPAFRQQVKHIFHGK